jgi:hypothetical protein
MKNIFYTQTESNQIELSINNQIFFLEWDEVTLTTLIFDWSGEYINEVPYQFNPNKGLDEYPNSEIINFILDEIFV